MSYRNRYYLNKRIRRKRTIPMRRAHETGVVLLFCLLLPYVAATLSGQAGAGTGGFTQDKLFILAEGENGTERIPLTTFLTGALAAGIDAGMEEETLKAQAVILRTAVWEAFGRREDQSADYVKAEELSQEYYSVYELKKNWKEEFDETYNRLRRIVEATDGVVMTYGGIPIKAPYFYASAGRTRNGGEVYAKGEYPYLVSVDSGQDRFCTEYGSSILYPESLFYEKAAELFAAAQEGTAQEGTVHTQVQSLNQIRITRDSAGYVSTVCLGETIVSGEAFRAAFGLPSSFFTLEQTTEGIRIITEGIGHGLGFSQYGANEMAKKGKLYDDLLKYYYHEIEIEKY